MKSLSRSLPLWLAAVFLASGANLLRAETLPPLYVATPVRDITVPAGTAASSVKLKKTFALTGVTGDVVRFSTTFGNVDVQLLAGEAPRTVANFLQYVNSGAYATSFFHRSVPNFILQGGAYSVTNGTVYEITKHDPVVNEFKVSNTRGTVAMAKLLGDPDSATDQWFFNEVDNSGNLDDQNGGFTVFASVIGDGMDVVDAIGALNVVNAGSPFDAIPVLSSFTAGGTLSTDDLVYTAVAPIPLVPKNTGGPGLLKLKITANTNPGLVTPEIRGNKLFLTYAPGVTGSAAITVKASGPDKGNKAKTSFMVTVQ